MTNAFTRLIERVAKFHAVGLAGAGVQLVALAFFTSLAGLNYLTATALAVEVAVLHNFCWHERWTWVERTRRAPGLGLTLTRLLRFNLTTGLVSIAANLILMRVFVGTFHLHYLPANVLTIATTSLANFLISELFVFRIQRH
ncbi:MAG: GtrA family protein [Bryobacteraceae bacterium]